MRLLLNVQDVGVSPAGTHWSCSSMQGTDPQPPPPLPPCSAHADTTIGLLLTILLHRGVLRATAWYAQRQQPPYEAADQAEEGPGESFQGGTVSAAAAAREPWTAALLLCGNYGGW